VPMIDLLDHSSLNIKGI